MLKLIEILETRRERLSNQFFLQFVNQTIGIHYLVNIRDSVRYNLKNVSKCHCPIPKTKHYKGSFIVYNLLQQ